MQPRIQSFVQQLVTGLNEATETGGYIDILAWYSWTTFDMIGDLAFGESFHCLEQKRTDPWISAVYGSIKIVLFMSTVNRYYLEPLINYLTPKKLIKEREHNLSRGFLQIQKRLAAGTNRGDFWDSVIEKSDFAKGTGITVPEMASNASVMILGGSETTATLLSGTTYLLLKHPEVMKKLRDEVRSTFKHDDEIDLQSVGKLDYMLAVLDEGLRIYPPVPKQSDRVVPPQGAMVAGKWVPGGVGPHHISPLPLGTLN